MYENIKSFLVSWNASTSERQKLQHTYLFIGIVAVFVAGLISLVNAELGHLVVRITLFALAAFITNAVVWNLLHSAIVSKLPTRNRRK